MKQFLTKFVPWLLGMLLLANLWQKLSFRDVQEAFQATGWWIVPIVCLSLLWLPSDTFAESRVLPRGAFGPRLALIEWSCDAFNTFIPMGGMGGEPFRYRHLRVYTPEPVKVLVGYRGTHAWTGLLATVVGTALCWWTGQPGPRIPRLPIPRGHEWPWLTGLGVVAFLIFSGGAWVARNRYWGHMSLTNLGKMFLAKSWSRVMQVAEVGVILWALGADLTLERVLIVHTCLLVAASLFVFVPGGWGVQETALAMGTQLAGLGSPIGLKLGLLRRFRQLCWSLLGMGAAAYLEATRKQFRAAHRRADEEPAG